MKATLTAPQANFLLEEGWYKAKLSDIKEKDGQYTPGIQFTFKIVDDRDLEEGEGTSKGKVVNGVKWSRGVGDRGELQIAEGSELGNWIQKLGDSLGEEFSEVGESLELKDLIGATVDIYIEHGEPTVAKKGASKGKEVVYSNVTSIRACKKKKASDDEDDRPKKKKVVDDDEDEKPKKKKKVVVDDDEDDRPKKKKVVDEDLEEFEELDDEDEKPKKKKKVVDEDEDDEDDRPKKKKKVVDDDDDDDDDRPKKKKNKYLGDEFDDDDEDEKPKKKKRKADDDDDDDDFPF